MSRVDFSRMYTIEHNVKVCDFGDVHPAHLGRLQSQWITVITDSATTPDTCGKLFKLPMETEEEDEEDEDEDDEEDDEEDESPYRYSAAMSNSRLRT